MGPGHPCFLVAEVGSNHSGSLDAALALIDAVAEAGADAVKFQAWHADHMYDPAQFPAEHASAVKWQLPLEWLPELSARAHKLSLAFGCSAFCFDALDEVDRWVDFHKVASIEANWQPFVEAVLAKGKPTFISNGMMDRRDTVALYLIAPEVIVLQCTVAYPAAIEDANVGDIPELSGLFAGAGLSDHTTHPTIAPCAAVALGACVVEKHLRPNLHDVPVDSPHLGEMTPDWPHSLGLEQFAEMVFAIRLTEKALGSSDRDSERGYLKYRRGSRGLRGA